MTPGVLIGARIAVTRPAEQAEELASPLRSLGADVVICPLIRIVAREFDANPRDFSWVVFTSVNGVEIFMRDRARFSTPVACVGAVTADAARSFGLDVRAVPEKFLGDAVAEVMGDVNGARVLIVRASRSENNLLELLNAAGASVVEVAVYDTEADMAGAARLREELGRVDVVTFTSSSAVRSFAEHVGNGKDLKVVVIGPVTAQTAVEMGVEVTAVAEPHTTAGIVDAIVKLWEEK